MSESELHIQLVRHLYIWVKNEIFEGDCGFILAELPEFSCSRRTFNLPAGPRPDLHAKRPQDGLLVIGEAKTTSDIETKQSQFQYLCYLEECERNAGPAMLVIAVPWHAQRSAVNLLRSLMKKNATINTCLKVIENLPEIG